MNKWRCCIKDPPPLGKKVLCHRKGDLFVGQRFDDYYIPMPFADHFLAKGLCKPETWCEIHFPEGLTGYLRIAPEGNLNEILTMDELKEKYPELYREHARVIIESIGAQFNWKERKK